jgi:hypothetical protein
MCLEGVTLRIISPKTELVARLWSVGSDDTWDRYRASLREYIPLIIDSFCLLLLLHLFLTP